MQGNKSQQKKSHKNLRKIKAKRKNLRRKIKYLQEKFSKLMIAIAIVIVIVMMS